MGWLVLLACFISWFGWMHWLDQRRSRWLPLAALAPIWFPFLVYVLYMLATESP